MPREKSYRWSCVDWGERNINHHVVLAQIEGKLTWTFVITQRWSGSAAYSLTAWKPLGGQARPVSHDTVRNTWRAV